MRRIDWVMICALVILTLGGQYFDYADGAVNPRAEQNPRRPVARSSVKKIWDIETQGWLFKNPEENINRIPAFTQLPKIGTIEPNIEHTSSVGSAFSISKQGLWLTARHVVTGCDNVMVQIGNKKALKINNIIFHPMPI